MYPLSDRVSDGRWTEPEFHSSDGLFGGASNKGEAALQLFLVKHADNQVLTLNPKP
jgi:hypothetical protein